MSRKLEEIKSDMNSHVQQVINSAIEEKELPSKKNAMGDRGTALNTERDLRSGGPHPSRFSQMAQK